MEHSTSFSSASSLLDFGVLSFASRYRPCTQSALSMSTIVGELNLPLSDISQLIALAEQAKHKTLWPLRTSLLFGKARSPDHLVRAQQDRLGDGNADCFRGFQIDDEFEFGRLLDRQIARLGALQNLVDVPGRTAV